MEISLLGVVVIVNLVHNGSGRIYEAKCDFEIAIGFTVDLTRA